jgi:hypothetical protein
VPHYLTNRGKLRLLEGAWADAGGTDIRIGLLVGASTPVGIDTEAEIQDLNFVSELLAVTGVDEPSDGSYARVTLTRSAPTEDDTNNRVNMDASDASFGALDNSDIYGAFIFDNTGGSDAARDLYSVDLFATPVTANGAGFTYAISDIYRAT